MPRVDLIARRDDYSNYQDAGSRDDSRIELRLNFNLFNGGSDSARSRQYRERKYMALDLREKACRDMRQTLSIAYNETARLKDQRSFLGLQVQLVEKTRTAYRDQFNIGQRTLLDLLNTQNEYFDARRAQVNADNDLALAYLRSYAGMGRLLEKLGLKQIDADNLPDDNDLTPVDLAQMCPVTTPADTTLDRDALARKARAMIESPTGNFIGRRAETPAPASMPAREASEKLATTSLDGEIEALTKRWRDAWVAQDFPAYLGLYSPAFKPEGGQSRDEWARLREQRISNARGIRVELDNLRVRGDAEDSATATFRQTYTAKNYSDISEKTLALRKENGQWRIVSEASVLSSRAQ